MDYVLGRFNTSWLQIAPTPFDNLRAKNTLTNPTPQIWSVEGSNWVILVPRLFPSKNYWTKRTSRIEIVILKFSVVKGQNGQVVNQMSKQQKKMWGTKLFASLLTSRCDLAFHLCALIGFGCSNNYLKRNWKEGWLHM